MFRGLASPLLSPLQMTMAHKQFQYTNLSIYFSLPLLQQTDLEAEQSSAQQGTTTTPNSVGPKRLHVSNIPFRFREADLKSLLGVSVCYRTVSKETHFTKLLTRHTQFLCQLRVNNCHVY